jgi:hypothetical protein
MGKVQNSTPPISDVSHPSFHHSKFPAKKKTKVKKTVLKINPKNLDILQVA